MGIFDFMREYPTNDPNLFGPAKLRPPTPGLHLPPGVHIPDWREYKVETCPELVEVQKKLAARGLKDPWLRNEVWRTDPKIWGTQRWVKWKLLSFGFKYAIPFFLIAITIEYAFKKEDQHHSKH